MAHVTRAMALIKVARAFQEIGVPVERELARARLPTLVEEMPDAYVSTALGYAFLERCEQIGKVNDIGWRAFGATQLGDMNAGFLRTAGSALTVHERLQRLVAALQLESNYIQCSSKPAEDGVRILFNNPHLGFACDVSTTEWSRLMAVIAVIQSGSRADWRPAEIGFISKFQPCDDALAYFGNTRLLLGQPHSSIKVPSGVLAMSVSPRSIPDRRPLERKTSGFLPDPLDDDQDSQFHSLRCVLQPYLGERRPSIELAAEIAGMSARSLQRKLRLSGLSFSELLDQCRFDVAQELLAHPEIKVIDVALSVGYDDPSHFARAFRRISGLCPRDYRRNVTEGRMAAPGHPSGCPDVR